jgi:hypothetical protein
MSFFTEIQQPIPTLNLTSVLVLMHTEQQATNKSKSTLTEETVMQYSRTASNVVRLFIFSGLQHKKQHLYLHWVLLISLGAITV